MKTRHSLLLIWLLSFLAACTFGQYSPEDIQATVQQLAASQIVQTLMAMPTGTAVPTEMPTVAPSSTVTATAQTTATATSSPTSEPTFQATWTPYGQANPTDFAADKEDKVDKNAPLLLDNQSGEEIHLIILSPIYVEYTFTKSFSLILAENTYTYRAWIGKNGPKNGTFSITNGDKHVLTFYTDKIHFSTP